MRFFIPIVALLACTAQASAMSGADDGRGAGLSRATQELQSALAARHANVTQWSIRPLTAENILQALPEETPSSVRVTHVGARSAVRLTWLHASTAYVQTLWFEVSGVAPAVVANRDVVPGAILSPADAVFAERDAMTTVCELLSTPAQLQQMRARRALRAGTPICREAIEPRPAVARGEDVLVRYVSQRVSITSKGIAQADAQVGQSVFVTNAASRDAFRAVVSALKEVVVYE